MPDKLTVMALDADDDLRGFLRSLPDAIHFIGEVFGKDDWYKRVRMTRPDVLVVEINPVGDVGKSFKAIERLKAEYPETAVFITSVSKSPELIISAMRTGAQEFLGKPVNLGEFAKAMERVKKVKDQAKAKNSPSGKIITIFSKKGGVGVTTVAVNLAIALSHLSEQKAAIVDLDLQLGDVASFLDLSPRYNIIDACGKDQNVDDAKLQSCMTYHSSGIYILAEPGHPADSDDVSPQQLNQILCHLKSLYPFVIIDTPHIFDRKVLGAMEISDLILLTAVPSLPSARATKRVLEILGELGYGQEKVKIIVNRVGKNDVITADNFKNVFGHFISWQIPNNYPAVIDAINAGRPLINQKRPTNVGKSIMDLAAAVTKWNHTKVTETVLV